MTDATVARLQQIIDLTRTGDTHTHSRIRELVERIRVDEVCDEGRARPQTVDPTSLTDYHTKQLYLALRAMVATCAPRGPVPGGAAALARRALAEAEAFSDRGMITAL
jgi:hypothetical protein